jgi:hypothetical protein
MLAWAVAAGTLPVAAELGVLLLQGEGDVVEQVRQLAPAVGRPRHLGR